MRVSINQSKGDKITGPSIDLPEFLLLNDCFSHKDKNLKPVHHQ